MLCCSKKDIISGLKRLNCNSHQIKNLNLSLSMLLLGYIQQHQLGSFFFFNEHFGSTSCQLWRFSFYSFLSQKRQWTSDDHRAGLGCAASISPLVSLLGSLQMKKCFKGIRYCTMHGVCRYLPNGMCLSHWSANENSLKLH